MMPLTCFLLSPITAPLIKCAVLLLCHLPHTRFFLPTVTEQSGQTTEIGNISSDLSQGLVTPVKNQLSSHESFLFQHSLQNMNF